jgi:hypothetical protein
MPQIRTGLQIAILLAWISTASGFQIKVDGVIRPAASMEQRGAALVAANPILQTLMDDFQALKDQPEIKPRLVKNLTSLAQGSHKPSSDSVSKLADNLSKALAGRQLPRGPATRLALELVWVFNSDKLRTRDLQSAILDAQGALRDAGVAPADVDLVVSDLKVIAPRAQAEIKPDVPTRPYRYPLSAPPKYDKSVLVEDFETGGDIWKRWYTPGWSTGIIALYDPENKQTGKFGLTISNDGPPDRASGMAYIPRPGIPIAGMNAILMWIRPYDADGSKGTVSTGIVDGSNEIWQVDVPDAHVGMKPYILEISLADVRRVLRRNNGVLDLECADYCFWMTGAYKFSVDDIMFVHDPALPEFVPQAPR